MKGTGIGNNWYLLSGALCIHFAYSLLGVLASPTGHRQDTDRTEAPTEEVGPIDTRPKGQCDQYPLEASMSVKGYESTKYKGK